MNLNEYQTLAARTIPTDKSRDMRIAEFCVGLNEEAGESTGVIKKVVFHHHPFNQEKAIKLIEELGDTLWHISSLAYEYGIALEEVAQYNVEKLKKRFPNGFTTEDSIKRVDTFER